MKNPYAFPLLIHEDGERNDGMELRDYFAAKALQSLIEKYENGPLGNVLDLSDSAYQYADAMLVARRKAQP